jgi:DNA-binding beta-propeller fold protein YncE
VAIVFVGSTAAVVAAREGKTTKSPAELTAHSVKTSHYEYVVVDGEIDVYDIDRQNAFVHRISVPPITHPHGVVANPRTDRLYVTYGAQGGSAGNGSMVALDLRTEQVLWVDHYDHGIDSVAVTPNGRTLYLPVGELSPDDVWKVIDAPTHKATGEIVAGAGPHNTVVSLDGRFVYLAGTMYPFLAVASTATNKVVRWIGPLKSGGRPFTINHAQTLAFTTAENWLGFQVSSIKTGKVLYTVSPPGFPYDPRTYTDSPSHGISLLPNERRIFVIDTVNGYVHVFDVSRLPKSPPRRIADIKLAHPPPSDGWLQASRDGRYVYVGRAGDVIDTRTLKIVQYLEPIQRSADFLEIDWRRGRPVFTTSRYGLGYAPLRKR